MKITDLFIFIIGITVITIGGTLAVWNPTAQLFHHGIYIIPIALLISNLFYSKKLQKTENLNRFIDLLLRLLIVTNTFSLFISVMPAITELMKINNAGVLMLVPAALFLLFRISQHFSSSGVQSDPIST